MDITAKGKPDEGHGVTTGINSAWREGVAFLLTVGIALWNQWDARDLLWGAWVTAVVSGFVLLSLPALFLLIPGSDRIFQRGEESEEIKMGFFGRIFGAAFLMAILAVPITIFILFLGTMLRGFAPEPLRGEFSEIPYLMGAMSFALKAYWPMVIIVTVVEVWRVIAEMIRRPSEGFIVGPLTDFFRLLGLSILLIILHQVGSPTLAVIPVLAILFIPPESIWRFLENPSFGRRSEAT